MTATCTGRQSIIIEERGERDERGEERERKRNEKKQNSSSSILVYSEC